MDTQIAERLQKIRKEHGYSQEQLADELGVSRQAISKWERGEASPDTDNLIALARLYNISVDNLLFDSVQSPVLSTHPEETPKSGHRNALGIVSSVTVLACCIVYFPLGSLLDLWHPAWIVFLLIPVAPSFAEAIIKRDATVFCFPVLITGVYLVLGYGWELWHPWWVLFLTIPIYYIIVGYKKK